MVGATGTTQSQDSNFGVQGTVHLVPDSRLNALLVSTASQNFPTIEGLVKRLDVNSRIRNGVQGFTR